MTDKQVFEIILSLAEREENIRAVLLEGSRANHNAASDKWQDFDIANVTSANAPILMAHVLSGSYCPISARLPSSKSPTTATQTM